MKIYRLLLAATCAATMSLAAPASAADFLFTYNGVAGSGITGTGTITTGTSNPSGSFFTPSLLITSINGMFNGSAITNLLPQNTFFKTSGIFGSPGNDNILYYPSSQTFNNQTTYIDRYGVGFDTAEQRVNLFFGLGGYGSVIQNTGSTNVTSDVVGTFTITPSGVGAVPEPASWAMMILGMGAIGFAMRRQKVTTQVSYAA